MEGDLMGHRVGDRSVANGLVEDDVEAELCGLGDEQRDLAEYWDWKTEAATDLDGLECQLVHVEDDSEGEE